MDIKTVRKQLDISNSDIAKMFGYANVNSYNCSSDKKRIEKGNVDVDEIQGRVNEWVTDPALYLNNEKECREWLNKKLRL